MFHSGQGIKTNVGVERSSQGPDSGRSHTGRVYRIKKEVASGLVPE